MKEFLIRTPIFSLENLMEFYNSKNAKAHIFNVFIENEVFKESIYLYSKVLYDEAIKYARIENEGLDENKKNKVADSLIKYFLRMCYRATPFGVSAGISIAEFGFPDINDINIDYKTRSVRIDSGVLFNILEAINALKIVKNNVRFYKNNTLYEKNGYYRYVERRKIKTSFEFNLEKVEKTEFLEEILELSEVGIRNIDIKNLLKDDEDLTEDDINEFINELIDSQLILSELQYNALDINFEKTLIKQIKQISDFDPDSNNTLTDIISCLSQVFELMENLRSQTLHSNTALGIIQKIDVLLSPYNKTEKPAIQIDLINTTNFKLTNTVKEDIKKNIPFLSKISNQITSLNNDIENFKKAYTNQYGDKTTPLLEVLDPDIGIGFPVKLSVNHNSSFLDRMNIIAKGSTKRELTTWDNFLLEKYECALTTNEKVIQVSEKDAYFSNITVNNDINDAVLVTGQILKTTNHDFKYFFNSFKVGGAQFIAGRFAYGDEKMEKFCKDIGHIEKESLNENQIFADLLHLSQPKLGNVILRPNCYDYYIPIIDATNKDMEHVVSLNDLYVAIYNNNIILYSKKLNKQVLPRLGCAQNTALLTSPIYKFLGTISDDYYINTWDWGFLSDRPYLPRVEFGKVILSKEKWLLQYKNIFNSNSKDIIILENYLRDKKVNRYVTMSLGGDNLLPLDLQNNECIKILFKELKTKSKIILEEDLYLDIPDTVFLNKHGKTTNEVCIPIHLNAKMNTKKTSIDLKKINSQIDLINTLSDIKLFPFDKVLYIKIYPKYGINVDDIFLDKLLLIINNLKNNTLFDNFFFIRYMDPNYHFRLRFFADRSNFYKIIDTLNDVFKEEIQSLLIDNLQVDTYEREISRYGGILGIEISEKIFYFDSVCVLKILSWVKHRDMHANLWLIASVGVHYLLNDFSIKEKNRLIILQESRDYYFSSMLNSKEVNKNISNFYNENKKVIEDKMDLMHFETEYFTFFKERSAQNRELISVLIENDIDIDIKSYIHMFLNRLFESNQNMQETIIYDLLIRYYKSLLFKTEKQ